MPEISLIIATHKRARELATALEYINRQTVASQLEIVVVSDGHDPDTIKTMVDYKGAVPVQFHEIKKSQQGVARNKGLEHATGRLCMFVNDDIFLEPEACQYHLSAHRRVKDLLGDFSAAVLGFTTWDETLDITRVMHWLEVTGWQFGYPLIKKYEQDFLPNMMQHRFSYTSHISLPMGIARKHPFRTDFTMYGWEDIEWGLRLRDNGIRLYYEPGAKAWHHHRITMADSLKRMEVLGESLHTAIQVAPGLDRMPRGLKRAAYEFASWLPTIAGRHRRAFLKGLKKGK